MGLYTRRQLVLLLVLLGAAGLGLGVVHWRASHPSLVERLEQLDRGPTAPEETTAEARPASRAARPQTVERAPRTPRAPKRRAPAADEPVPPLDLNRAMPAELARLPGIGPVLARRIVEAREAVGRFGAIDELVGVRGLGRAKLDRLRPLVAILE
jgi:competence ComEA-like helix-hairpin-helix protein